MYNSISLHSVTKIEVHPVNVRRLGGPDGPEYTHKKLMIHQGDGNTFEIDLFGKTCADLDMLQDKQPIGCREPSAVQPEPILEE